MPSNAAIPIHLVVICGEVAVTQRVVNARIADNCASRQIVADNVLGIRMIGYHQGLGFCTFSPTIGTFDPVTTKGIVYTRRPPRVTDGYLLHNVRVEQIGIGVVSMQCDIWWCPDARLAVLKVLAGIVVCENVAIGTTVN